MVKNNKKYNFHFTDYLGDDGIVIDTMKLIGILSLTFFPLMFLIMLDGMNGTSNSILIEKLYKYSIGVYFVYEFIHILRRKRPKDRQFIFITDRVKDSLFFEIVILISFSAFCLMFYALIIAITVMFSIDVSYETSTIFYRIYMSVISVYCICNLIYIFAKRL